MNSPCGCRSAAARSRSASTSLGLLGALAFLLPNPAPAEAQCISYSDYIRVLGSSEEGLWNGWDVAIHGAFAYVADGEAGVRIFDVTNPATPTLVRTMATPFIGRALAADNGLLFVGHGGGDFRIYDLANATNPVLLSIVDLPGYLISVAAVGSRAYVVSKEYGLSIVDASNPSDPRVVSSLDTPGTAWGVAVDGDRVLIADGSVGLHVVDISIEEAPVVTATVNTPGTATQVAVRGEIAYVADRSSGVQIVALDTTPPSIVGAVGTRMGRDAHEIAVAGNHLLVMNDELRTFDLSTPTAPVEIGSIHLWGWSVVVTEQWAAVVSALGLFTVGLDNLANPPAVLTNFNPDMHWLDFDFLGDVAYVASGPEGIVVLDVSDPSRPEVVGSMPPLVQTEFVAVDAGRLYAANDGGFQTFDCTDPSAPELLSTLPGFWFREIAVRDDYVFAGQYPQGLSVIDVHDPTSPVLVVTMPQYQQPDGIAIAGTTLYIGDWDLGFLTFDIADPTNPVQIGQLNPWGGAGMIAIAGNFAYLAHHEFMSIVRIADPRSPTLVADIPSLDMVTDVVVGNSYAYVATRMGGVQIVDVRHPTAAHTVGWHDGPWFALNLGLHEDYLWVTGDVLDVIPTQCRPVALEVSGLRGAYESGAVRLWWTSAPTQGFRVFRSEPGSTNEEVVGETRSNGAGEAAFVDMPSRSAVFRYGLGSLLDEEADPSLGAVLVTVPPHNVPELLLAGPMPNPTRSESRCVLTLRAPGHVRVGIYDAGGRLVRTLLNERREAGEHAVAWDGRDSHGKAAAAGVYFLDIAAGRRSETRKVVLQK